MAKAADYCARFTFDTWDQTKRTRSVSRALARVYAGDATTTAAKHEGAATIIHTNPLLLVTAGHVVPSDTVKVAFPEIDHNHLYVATVIARPAKPTPGAAKGAEEPHDFAVLQVERPPAAGINALELWLDYISDEEDHHLAAYTRDSPVPVWGDGQLAKFQDCAWRLRQTVFNGDSGGAVVHASGLLVGIVLDGREGGQFNGGAMGQATILPLTCVRETIMSAIDKAVPASKSNALDVERADLVQKLKPPAIPGWIDNLDFARALRDVMKSKELARRLQKRDAITCPLVKSAIERKLGYETVERLIKFAAADTKDAGDEFKKSGDLIKSNDSALAKRMYASAVDSYEDYVRANLAVPSPPGIRHQIPSNVRDALIARAYTLTALAQIDPSSSVQTAAIGAAVQAVNATSKSGNSGIAYAILGNAAFNAGDFQTAIEAYSSASQKGYNPVWVKQSYMEAFRRRDNVSQPAFSDDYEAIGTYRGLNASKLLTLGGTSAPDNTEIGSGGAHRFYFPGDNSPTEWKRYLFDKK